MVFERSFESDRRIVATAGHWSDHVALTGCTVVLFDAPAPAVVDVRGGAPGSRETALLGPGDLVQDVDAILLTGGSAFGLGAADGVMRFLREQDRGVRTSAGPVPIVPTAVLFDLNNGQPIWPDSSGGFSACEAAVPIHELARGQIGVGTGATTHKLFPDEPQKRGGLGYATIELGEHESVHAIVAVNAAGSVLDSSDGLDPRLTLLPPAIIDDHDRESTTLAVVIIDAPVDRRTLTRAATAAHDAFARRILPCHTIFDGDIVFATALRTGPVTPDRILAYSVAVEIAVERAIIDAVTA